MPVLFLLWHTDQTSLFPFVRDSVQVSASSSQSADIDPCFLMEKDVPIPCGGGVPFLVFLAMVLSLLFLSISVQHTYQQQVLSPAIEISLRSSLSIPKEPVHLVFNRVNGSVVVLTGLSSMLTCREFYVAAGLDPD